LHVHRAGPGDARSPRRRGASLCVLRQTANPATCSWTVASCY